MERVTICVNKNIKEERDGGGYEYKTLLDAVKPATVKDEDFWVLGANMTPVQGYTSTLVKVKYDKKIYSPGEVVLTFTCAVGGEKSSMDLSGKLKGKYLKKEPFLIDVVGFKGGAEVNSETTVGDKVDIAINYYVYGISIGLNPAKMSDRTSCQYTLRCFSLDKKLTLDKYSDTYVGRCLSTDICAAKDKDNKPTGVFPAAFSFFGDKRSDLYDCSSGRLLFLGYSSGPNGVLAHRQKGYDQGEKKQHGFELKQPYLVQYNESFYDFLSRTLHRCGEFLYFEKGKLCIGLPSETLKVLDKISDTSHATSWDKYSSNIPYCEYPEISLSDESVQEVRTFSNDCTDSEVSDRTFNSVKKYEITYKKEVKVRGKDGEKTEWEDEKGVVEADYMPYYANISSDENFHKVTENDASVDSYKMWIVYTFLDTFFKSDAFIMGLFSALLGLAVNIGVVNGILTQNVKKKLKEKYVYDPSKSNEKVPYFTYDVGLTDNICNDFYRQVELWEEISGKNKVKMSFFTNLPQMYLADAIYLKDDIWNDYVIIGMSGEYTTGSSSHSAEAVPIIKDNLPLYMGKETETGKEIEVEKEILIETKTKKIIEIATGQTAPEAGKTEKVKAKVKVKEIVKGAGVQGVVLPPPGIPHTLRSSAMEAVVTDNDDPLRIGRVRVKYLWQTDPIPSPWVRVTVPFTGSADMDSGFLMTPDKGEHVMLDYIGGNIEQPYVNGSVYYVGNRPTIGDKAPEHPQYWPSKRIRTIASSNGHNLTFADGNSFSFLEVLVPPLKPIASIIDRAKGDESRFKKTGSAGSAIAEKEKNFELKGGKIVLGDGSALCSIGIYPGERKVAINSSFGSVQVDAFTGISLSSPNGDINISAKNINIKAGNNITIQSGTNINRNPDSGYSVVGAMVGKVFGMGIVTHLLKKKVGVDFEKCMDFTFLRCVMDSILRPVEGTLSLRSNRNTILTAGAGKVTVPNNYLAQTLKARTDWEITEGRIEPNLKWEKYNEYKEDTYFRELREFLTATRNTVHTYFNNLNLQLSEIEECLGSIESDVKDENVKAQIKEKDDFILSSLLEGEGKDKLSVNEGTLTDETFDKWFGKNKSSVANGNLLDEDPSLKRKSFAETTNKLRAIISGIKWKYHDSLKMFQVQLASLVSEGGLLNGKSLAEVVTFGDDFKINDANNISFLGGKNRITEMVKDIPNIRNSLPYYEKFITRLVLCYVIFTVWKSKDSKITISKVKKENNRYIKELYESKDDVIDFAALWGSSYIVQDEAWQCFVDGIGVVVEKDAEHGEGYNFGTSFLTSLASSVDSLKGDSCGGFFGNVRQIFNWGGESGPRKLLPSSGSGGGNLFISNNGGHLTMLNDEGTGWNKVIYPSVKPIKDYLKKM